MLLQEQNLKNLDIWSLCRIEDGRYGVDDVVLEVGCMEDSADDMCVDQVGARLQEDGCLGRRANGTSDEPGDIQPEAGRVNVAKLDGKERSVI